MELSITDKLLVKYDVSLVEYKNVLRLYFRIIETLRGHKDIITNNYILLLFFLLEQWITKKKLLFYVHLNCIMTTYFILLSHIKKCCDYRLQNVACALKGQHVLWENNNTPTCASITWDNP